MGEAEDSAAILDRLTKLHPKLIDLSLGRIVTLLERLGDPHRKLPPVVHVAGTNGKGSVIAFLRAALEAAGFGVHVHISPHLVKFNERIRLAGELISEAALVELLRECEEANGGDPITFFEITCAAALLAFSRHPADIVLLETGLGGRLDATNVVERPMLTTLTPISLDHQQFLGDSLAEIAAEKAGILKPGVPCVLASQAAEADAAIRSRAAEVGAPLFEQDRDWSVVVAADGWIYEGPGGTLRLPPPNLTGPHQIANAGMALAAIEHMEGIEVGEKALIAGVTGAEWPARLQRLVSGPLVDLLPDGWELWLDGGHNPAAGDIIARWAEEQAERPLHLIVGMLTSKDAGAFLRPLAATAESVGAVVIPGVDSAMDPTDIAAAADAVGLASRPAKSVAAALARIIAKAGDDPEPARVMICGSLYLAGDVLADNG